MYNTMKKLIEAHYYKTQADAQKKLDVFYAMSKLTDDEYIELTSLVEMVYNPIVDPIE